jgi:hypothetical protein
LKPAFAIAVLAALPCSRPALLAAQATDPAQAIGRALPPDVAQRVLARIADARAHGVPADVLTRRALELSSKGVAPPSIESAVADEAGELETARRALATSGRRDAADDELDAAATAMRRGVSGSQVSELAKAAPSGRSLAVPLFVISSLVDRGLPSDQALQRVLARLQARASDQDLEGLAQPPGRADQGSKLTGLDMAETHRPANAGRPAWVPANDGKGNRPQNPGQQGQGKL